MIAPYPVWLPDKVAGPGDKTLEHLVWFAGIDKAAAWRAAKDYAEINPHDCADMPERLKQRMLKEKENGQV